ncbi:hypothetical protein ACNFH5_30260 [Pseudomonas sp. NY15435]|uniref:hypothetical protein n=1 Tax=Pseudomonas sp. NY15435 TaxID=3400358 RepID=UPI003A8A020E
MLEGIEPGWVYTTGAVSRLKQAKQLLEQKEKTSTILTKLEQPEKSPGSDDRK